MNLTEQKFWKLIKPHLPGDVSRVENTADNGMPDINGTCGIDYWIELKVCDNKGKKRPVEKLLRPDQIVWHTRRIKQGACVLVLVRYEDRILVYYAKNTEGKIEYLLIAPGIGKNKGGFDWGMLVLNTKEVLKYHWMLAGRLL